MAKLSATAALLFVAGSLQAATLTTEHEATYVVHGAHRPDTPMAAWEANGQVASASGAAAVADAPRGAVRYAAKLVAWPTATVKVLTFSKDSGGVLHPITDERTVYVLEGGLQATVDGAAVDLAAGDLASLPEGALRNSGGAQDAVVVAWTAGSLTPDATPAVVKGGDVDTREAGQLTIRRYEFPGNSVRVVGLGKGLKTNEASAKTDSLIYLTGGPLKFFQQGEEYNVTAGDFIREVAGAKHYWNVTEESGFVTTSALPLGAAPIDPDEATDRPPR